MTTYTLQIGIQNTEYAFLKENQYRLCIAKLTDNGYTVVWRGGDFAEVNHFRWSEEYQALWTETYKTGILVETKAFGSDIKFGQTVEIKPDGQMGDATGNVDPSASSFTVVNHLDKAVHVALNSRVNGSWKPCYVSKFSNGSGDTIKLTPINKVKVWFDQNLKTGTMISEAVGTGFEVDFTTGMKGQVAWYGASGSNYGDKGIGKPGRGEWKVISGMEPDDDQ